MESDQPNLENSEQVNSDDLQGASQARSYDCTFCKRGFSNAQALGGHMNIHRKEKVVLKRVETNKSQPSSNSTLPRNSSWPLETKPSSDERSTKKLPWMLASQQGDRDETHVGDEYYDQVQQLPLFVETSSQKDHKPGSQLHSNIEKDLSTTSTTHASSGSGIDLELRLGPEPQDPSAPTAIQKFF